MMLLMNHVGIFINLHGYMFLFKTYFVIGGCIPVTPQMIRAAVKRLHLRRAFVNTNLISQYLRRSYPVENDLRLFSEELKKKLDCAVRVGLIVKHGEDAYCLPTLREEANIFDTLCTTFWEIYRNYPGTAQTRYQNRKRSTTKKKKRLEGIIKK
nr:PREDICTED: uncharacterized protein LOC105663386 [Megachile rotundata]